jgi:DNA-binding NtrC family response regulator
MSFIEQIWIVDDDSSIRWVMEKALTRAGLDCRAFESADDVLAALSSEEPMVVVSDIRMPGMDGIQLLAQIRTQQPESAGHHHHRALRPRQRSERLRGRRFRIFAQALRYK